MQLIECPWCGPREREPSSTTAGRPTSPTPPSRPALSDEQWAQYLFFRDNPAARSPSAGCTPPAAGAGSTPCATPSPTSSSPSTGPASPPAGGRASMTPDRLPTAAGSTAHRRCTSPSTARELRRPPGRHPGLGAAGQRRAPGRDQRRLGRPRGIMAAGVEEPSALVQLDGAVPRADADRHDRRAVRRPGRPRPARPGPPGHRRPTRPATTPCTPTATCWSSAPGRPAWPPRSPPPAPAPRASWSTTSPSRAARCSDRTSTEPARLGGRRASPSWPPRRRPRPARTTAFGCYDDGFVLALEKPHRPPRRAPATASAAAGLADPGPAGRARHRRARASDRLRRQRPARHHAGRRRPRYLHRYGVLVGSRVVVFTTNDSAYDAAVDLAEAGAEVVRSSTPGRGRHVRPMRRDRDRRRTGTAVIGTPAAPTGVTAVRTSAAVTARSEVLDCDLLLVSGGWNPAVHLYSQAGGRLGYDAAVGAFVPDGVGRASGGRRGGRRSTSPAAWPTAPAVAAAHGRRAPATVAAADVAAGTAPARRALAGAGRTATGHRGLRRPAARRHRRRRAAGHRRRAASVEHVKRYTTIGTAHDQGKTSGVLASGIVADALGVDVADLGTTTFRPPYTPVAFAALAGRDRGDAVRPGPDDRDPPLARRARRGVRERRAVEAAVVLPAARRGRCDAAVPRECRGGPHRRRA